MYERYPDYSSQIRKALRAAPGGKLSALELGKATGMNSGLFYAIAAQMEAEGTLYSAWEPIPEAERTTLGADRRRVYEALSDTYSF